MIFIVFYLLQYSNSLIELAWRSGCVIDCHAATQGSNPGGDELHVLRKGQ